MPNRSGPDREAERLDRLDAWETDLSRLIGDAQRAGDHRAQESAKTMLAQCRQFIAEATRRDRK